MRTICREECERYDSTWACPPAVGTLQECEKKIKSYPQAVFFSSVAEVSDIMNMEEMLSTRRAHEDLTTEVGKYLNLRPLWQNILKVRDLIPLPFRQNPVISVKNVPIKRENHADILTGCIHVWKVMV